MTNNNNQFELEIIYTNNDIQYLTSSTPYLNQSDIDFLNDLDVSIDTIKTINIENLTNKFNN